MEEIAVLAMRVVLESHPKAQFSIVKLGDQEYIEVENSFTQQYHSELGDTWYVLNNQGSYHKLIYNESYLNPLIKEGWESLKTFHGLPETFELVFSYYGHSCFGITDIKEITCAAQVPTFHSRSIWSRETTSFDVTCTHLAVYKNKLRIEGEFADFVRQKQFDCIEVFTDDGECYTLNVLLKGNYRAYISDNWSHFTGYHGFNPGDVLRFKFGPGDKCHLFKIAN